jgi:putative glutamine amidotransferase
MLPTIGLAMSISDEDTCYLFQDYVDAVVQAGGVPLLLPITKDKKIIREFVEKIDGLLLTGGGDIDPKYFQEEPVYELGEVTPERDYMELEMIRTCLQDGKPIFGICRGCQILNVFFGGDLYQDLRSQRKAGVQHTQNSSRYHPTHSIAIKSDSILYKITKKTKIRVNSFHHQAARKVVFPLKVSARASDNVIEALEGEYNRTFILGVQWHPERMVRTSRDARNIMKYFILQCRNAGKNGNNSS